MATKHVINLIFMLFIYSTSVVYGQSAKYLLFDKSKDSIVKIGNIKYYKIDNNLFDIIRYSKKDTIFSKVMGKINFTNVNELWKDSRNTYDSIINEGVKSKRLEVIDTYNQIFKHIYVLEKISNCSYKRTRVWWIDY